MVAARKRENQNRINYKIHLFFNSKKILQYIHVAPGQGLTTPRGRNFYVNRNILSLWSFAASLKKNLFEV